MRSFNTNEDGGVGYLQCQTSSTSQQLDGEYNLLAKVARSSKNFRIILSLPFGGLKIWIFVYVLAAQTFAGPEFKTVCQRVWKNNSRDFKKVWLLYLNCSMKSFNRQLKSFLDVLWNAFIIHNQINWFCEKKLSKLTEIDFSNQIKLYYCVKRSYVYH